MSLNASVTEASYGAEPWNAGFGRAGQRSWPKDFWPCAVQIRREALEMLGVAGFGLKAVSDRTAFSNGWRIQVLIERPEVASFRPQSDGNSLDTGRGPWRRDE